MHHSTFSHGLELKTKIATQQYRIAILVESKFFKKKNVLQFFLIAIHIVSAPKYRDNIKSEGRCIVPSLMFISEILGWTSDGVMWGRNDACH